MAGRVALATVERVAYEMNLARRVDCSGARALITGTALHSEPLAFFGHFTSPPSRKERPDQICTFTLYSSADTGHFISPLFYFERVAAFKMAAGFRCDEPFPRKFI